MNFTHCDVRESLETSAKREATSRSMHLLREMFHEVNKIITSSLLLVSGILRVKFLVLVSIQPYVRA